MPHFFFKLVPPRPSFAMDMTADEKAMMQRHATYWRLLLDDGKAVAFGPVLDPNGPYGIGIVSAPDQAAARALSDADPAIASKHGFVCEIYPMNAVTRDSAAASA